MKINSQTVTVAAPQQEVFDFLKDANNIIHLLPQDKISDFKSSTEDCSFKVQGGVIISLIHDGDEAPNKLFMKSGEKSPFPFRLTIHTGEQSNETEGRIEFDGQVNMFLKMMVEKPLTNLFDYMSKKLQEHFA
ncbi:MAG: hypothetical protein AB8B56_19140 [Crocinitomicaceae bacterium]